MRLSSRRSATASSSSRHPSDPHDRRNSTTRSICPTSGAPSALPRQGLDSGVGDDSGFRSPFIAVVSADAPSAPFRPIRANSKSKIRAASGRSLPRWERIVRMPFFYGISVGCRGRRRQTCTAWVAEIRACAAVVGVHRSCIRRAAPTSTTITARCWPLCENPCRERHQKSFHRQWHSLRPVR